MTFAHIMAIYNGLSPEIRQGVDEMVEIINNPASSEDEVQMSLDTLTSALFDGLK